MDVVVRLADRGAAAELAAIHRESAFTAFADIFPPEAPPPTYDEDLEKWQHWLGPDWERGRRAYAAYHDHAAVGVVLAGPDLEDPDTGHLARLYVRPEWWGHGIGGLLYEAAIGDLRRREFAAATLWVLEGNARARSWYERLGWALTHKRKPVYPPAGIVDVQYRLPLLDTQSPGPLRRDV